MTRERGDIMDLEEKLIQDIKAGRDVSLERGLLIISGLNNEAEIEAYTRKLDQIYNEFITKLTSKSPVSMSTLRKYMARTRAESLFDYLWNTKPRRCNSNFFLTDVIDAQLNPDVNQKVGSCVGLTGLYTVLGLREGLDLTILVSDSHIMNRLRVDGTIFNIDNTDSLGFDCSLNEEDYIECPATMFLANVFNSRGMAQERKDDLEGAIEDYKKAIEINQNYANAYNNRGNIKAKQQDYRAAIRDYDRALGLNTLFVEAYCNRGIAKESLGDYNGAIRDFDQAIATDSAYLDAYFRRAMARASLNDYHGAKEDLDKVIELDPESKDKVMPFRDQVERDQS